MSNPAGPAGDPVGSCKGSFHSARPDRGIDRSIRRDAPRI